ncbi:uncharacterized protein EV422DRAFT_520917 [Fimicolochytrium jonesii]|uniref:uncharacterized protein n=1 Tax=Fimicolochytrium jonesii TaxID=1396493 RepID=UPI0022FDE4B2|nr:uncharacterized protein EV422DRAFT_520917 [Fimicolochytrium jonesii]KAI8823400.1 hypothetical protein EV422DRAFT_520917 [Fimicolochytrium jonesii]
MPWMAASTTNAVIATLPPEPVRDVTLLAEAELWLRRDLHGGELVSGAVIPVLLAIEIIVERAILESVARVAATETNLARLAMLPQLIRDSPATTTTVAIETVLLFLGGRGLVWYRSLRRCSGLLHDSLPGGHVVLTVSLVPILVGIRSVPFVLVLVLLFLFAT